MARSALLLRRFWRWCRTHPRAAGIGAAAFVILAIVGNLTQPDKTATSNAGDTVGPATSSASGTASTKSSTSTPSNSAPSYSSARSTSTPPRSSAATAGPVSQVPADRSQASGTTATSVLATIAIKGRAPEVGYGRDQFGAAWTDDTASPLSHNGCDTRNDILRRDLVGETSKPNTNGCVVVAGALRDPYTSRTIAFRRGETTSLAVQIDHVVALSDAWQTGAQRYDLQTRAELANDPLNLLAVDGATNEAKGDGDAATWLPPNKAYRCAYVARQIAVKARYQLWMTPAESAASVRVLASCPGQAVPVEKQAPEIGRVPAVVTITHHRRTHAATSRSVPAPSTHVSAGCTTTSTGTCIQRGRFCPGASYGRTGTDASGDALTCGGDSRHPRWE